MYTQLLHLIHILLLLVNNVVGVHAVRMVDSLYCQCSAYDLVLILEDNKVFVFVFVFTFLLRHKVWWEHFPETPLYALPVPEECELSTTSEVD